MPPGGARGERSVAGLAVRLCGAGSAGGVSITDASPEQPKLTYLTETASGAPKVWIAAVNGSGAKLLGPGEQPLLAPNGQAVAVALFGTASGPQEHGPAIGIYPTSGAAIADYLSLEAATATPLAWSPDSRYLAVYAQSNGTAGIAAALELGRDRHADRNGRDDRTRRDLRRQLRARRQRQARVRAGALAVAVGQDQPLCRRSRRRRRAPDHQRRAQPVARLGADVHRLRP